MKEMVYCDKKSPKYSIAENIKGISMLFLVLARTRRHTLKIK